MQRSQGSWRIQPELGGGVSAAPEGGVRGLLDPVDELGGGEGRLAGAGKGGEGGAAGGSRVGWPTVKGGEVGIRSRGTWGR